MFYQTINMTKAKILRLNIGIKIGGEIIFMIRFADNIVMIAVSGGDIQCTIDEINEMLRTSEIKINSAKTRILVCAKDPKIKADLYMIGN